MMRIALGMRFIGSGRARSANKGTEAIINVSVLIYLSQDVIDKGSIVGTEWVPQGGFERWGDDHVQYSALRYIALNQFYLHKK